jgi:2-hydroxy-6-oxonona-2,4-dienedioate hydrolase
LNARQGIIAGRTIIICSLPSIVIAELALDSTEFAGMTMPIIPVADGLDEHKLRNIEVDGISVRLYEDGTGEPLVLLSGGEFGSLYSLDSWSLNLKGLARNFHVYALDKPGQGYSDIPKRDADYTFEWLLERTYRTVNALGIRKGHFVGHSRGALLVARMALDCPEMIKTAIVVDSSTMAPEDPHVATDLFYNELAARTLPGLPTRETVRMEVDAQSFSKAHITDDYVERMLRIALLPSIQEAQRRMAALRLSVCYPSLHRMRSQTLAHIDERGLPVPTLVIWGFNDRAAPLYLGHRLFERICPKTPNAEFHAINRTGHYSFREQWQKFNRIVRGFCLGLRFPMGTNDLERAGQGLIGAYQAGG